VSGLLKFIDLDNASFFVSGNIKKTEDEITCSHCGNKTTFNHINLCECQIDKVMPKKEEVTRENDQVLFFRVVQETERMFNKCSHCQGHN